MAMLVNLPSGWGQVGFYFGGLGLPTGGAVSFGINGAGTPNTPDGLATELIGYWTTRIAPVTCNDVKLVACRVKFGPMETGPFALVGANVPGTFSGSVVSPAVAYLIRKVSTIGGKSGSGRMYHPGLSESEVTQSGNIAGTRVTSLQAAWDAFMADLAASTLEMSLLHTYGTYINSDGNTVAVPPVDPTPITKLTVDPIVATQRRRQRR